MPCLEVSLPRVPEGVRARLAQTLTAAFTEHSGFPADIFGVRFLEYDWGQAAQGGQLSRPKDERPYLHILLYTPRLRRAVKQALAAALSEAFAKAVERPAWRPVIHFCEHPYDNVAVDGRLLSDAYPELAGRPFYYPLTEQS